MQQDKPTLETQAGFLWTWWKEDPLPSLSPLPELTISTSENIEALANVMEVSSKDVTAMLQQGHQPYLARLGTQEVAVGWSAIGPATFGGGRVTFHVPSGNRYLYFFVTLPPWRGLGIYPHLLQHVLRNECDTHKRFWIIHQLENSASQRGINKAGFLIAGEVYFLSTGGLGLVAPDGGTKRARIGAALLGLPLIGDTETLSGID